VEVARAESTPSESAIRSVGTLMSDESVTVSAEQTGRIVDIRFQEGQKVEAGDILVKLDDSLLQAELADARSRLVLAEGNLRRATTLSKTGAGTERASDEAKAAHETARAALELAQVRLSKTEIRAPFSGTVGLRLQSVGAFVQPGQAMVNLEKIDVLKLDFKVPELFLAQIRPGQSVEIAVDAIPDRTFTGEIYAINPLVDVNGRALSIRARLANKDGLLRPGLFARVGIRRHAGERVVIVPEGAIVPRGSGPVVFRVQNGKALETPVRLGERRSGAVEIVSGVGPEDTVVTAGHARLRDGASVEVVASQART
jgi:membrane fusion protein (multidrug efflux system)